MLGAGAGVRRGLRLPAAGGSARTCAPTRAHRRLAVPHLPRHPLLEGQDAVQDPRRHALPSRAREGRRRARASTCTSSRAASSSAAASGTPTRRPRPEPRRRSSTTGRPLARGDAHAAVRRVIDLGRLRLHAEARASRASTPRTSSPTTCAARLLRLGDAERAVGDGAGLPRPLHRRVRVGDALEALRLRRAEPRLLIAATTAAVTSTVVPWPPRSGVRGPCAIVAPIAPSTACDASVSPRWSKHHRGRPRSRRPGWRHPGPRCPARSPWTGSNIAGEPRSGLRLPDGAMPIEPATAAARSDRMSPNRLEATITSNRAGCSTTSWRERVDQHLLRLQLRVVATSRGEPLVPERHRRGADPVDFGEQTATGSDGGRAGAQAITRSVPRRKTASGRCQSSSVFCTARRSPSTRLDVAHDHHVDWSPGGVAQRATRSRQQLDRVAKVHVLAERAPDRDQQPPQRDVVGHVRPPDGAEQDRVTVPQPLQPVRSHHPAVLHEVVAAPRVFGRLEAESIPLARRLQHLQRGRRDLTTDPVPGHDGNAI